LKVLHGSEEQDRGRSGVLHILVLEDSTSDAELVGARLSEDGLSCELALVRSRDAFAAALKGGGVDLILADYALPGFDGLSAMRLAKELRPSVPFIFVSGTPGEEVAIEALKSGATDYVLKHRLERLLPAVQRAMREAEERRERERVEEELARLASFPRLSPITIVETAVVGEPTYINPAAQEQFPGLIELGPRHPILADLTSVDREIRESDGQPVTSEVWVDDVLYQRLIFTIPGSDLLRLYVTDITERRRAEEALRRSEERFRSLVRYASDIILILDAEGIILYESPAVERILGFRPEERIGTDAFSHIHPDDLGAVRSRFAELLDNPDRRLSAEYRMRDRSGVWRQFEAIGTNLLDDAVVRGVVVNTRDISERRRAEGALRNSEELYRTVVQQASENIFVVDVESRRILEANAALQRSLGYSLEDLKEMTLYDVVAHDRKGVDEITELIIEEGQYVVGERRYRRKDGSLVDVEVNVGVIPYGDRRAMCIVAHDITEHKHAEATLRQSLSVLRAMREAGQVLSSTLESEEIITRLLEIMRSVASLTAAVISRFNEEGNLRVWRSAGLEELWPRVRFTPEAEAARSAVLENEEQQLFRMRRPGSGNEYLVGLCLPIGARDRIAGVLEAYGQESLAQGDMVEIISSLTSQAASALENARLYEELGDRERALQNLVGKLLGAQEEERRRVAYEVHDGLAQVAVAAHQNLQAFARRHAPEPARGRRELDRILRQVRATVSDARRVIANLRPTALDDLGLAAAISLEVEHLNEEGYRVDYEEHLGDERLPEELEITLFRVAQEALTNMRKHAGTQWVRIELRRRDGEVYLEVRDFGRGFDPAALETLEGGPGERVGFAGMRERVSMLGGELEILSRPDAGVSIAATIPLTRTT
jgi:PAS domain S-box-containing protein